ncbi:GNAT family N-acetyltransferase [Lacinutrix sp. Bg11-31]|uniref:GNAT family N-acetyltransferase n=1 Tax=Lacinutrix sp. Bg11-31 TaxID=2057808 RepID=UPI000C3197EE|nr:GNAT family N-acetyltransferase [Lacinutrix sp. Bg11-31]AUC82749.1 GNAT family N-acetyltransferase [Lacinutrix sp. Bg11-31]
MIINYKKCDLSNLETLTAISKSTFIDAFGSLNNPEEFNSYIEKAFSKKQIEKELLNPNSTFYFAYAEEQIIGYFKLNVKDAQNEIYEQESIELERIYILSQFQNKGLGKLFLNEIIAQAKTHNASFLWLGVWSKNKNAIRFYERLCFKQFDTHAFYLGSERQLDSLMKLDLSNF